MNMKQNKNSKFVSILSSLAIGIAGSFLWEFICSPLFHSVFNIVFSAPAKVSQTASRIEHNIEIVSPYITDQEYKVLKSNSYSMKTMDDYNLLNEALEDVAEQHHLQLH